jgi:hypothetical protein
MMNHAQTVLCTLTDFHYHNSQKQLTSTNYSLYNFVRIHKSHDETMPKSVLALRKTRAGEEQTFGPNVQRVTDDELVRAMYTAAIHG